MTTKTEADVIEVPRNAEESRELAIKRLKAKHDFKVHLVVYLAVNAFLVVLWALTNAGEPYPQGAFWPIFPILGWGVAIAINAYVVYGGKPYTEDRIQREMKKSS